MQDRKGSDSGTGAGPTPRTEPNTHIGHAGWDFVLSLGPILHPASISLYISTVKPSYAPTVFGKIDRDRSIMASICSSLYWGS
jgi:hypothetical protein